MDTGNAVIALCGRLAGLPQRAPDLGAAGGDDRLPHALRFNPDYWIVELFRWRA